MILNHTKTIGSVISLLHITLQFFCVLVVIITMQRAQYCLIREITLTLGLSDTTVLVIYRDILKVSISRYFVINYRDTMPVHYCH